MKRLLFLFFSAALVVLFVMAMWQDTAREWTGYQRQFFKSLAGKERRGLSGGIKQLIVTDLSRVDRCTTCHLAVDKPQLALAVEPLNVHPALPGETDDAGNPLPLKWHPPEKFGCTICHGGQGLATEVKAAHGDVEHWEQPLLRGRLVQASCRQCHGDLEPMAQHVPVLLKGMELFKAKGCYGCHTVRAFTSEFGQTVSVELSEVGAKPYQLITADFEMMPEPHDRIHWLSTKLHTPRTLNPGGRKEKLPPGEEEVYPTAMPNFGLTDDEVEALTVYLLSLVDNKLPAKYVRPPTPKPEPTYATAIERGRAAFTKYGCVGCHGQEAGGGRKNVNAQLYQEVPPLVFVRAYYDPASLKALIRNGRQPVPRADPSRPTPSLYMPAWKDKIPDAEIDDIVEYLLSLVPA